MQKRKLSSIFQNSRRLTALICCALSAAVLAANTDDTEQPWQELAVQFPAAPQAQNLLPFYVSPTATQQFALDSKSLTLGADGVWRFTLVAVSDSGSKNISYEGIRCASFESKLYAFGRQDGSWAASRKDQWRPIALNTANRQQAALAVDFLCQNKSIAGKPEQILQALRAQSQQLLNPR